MNVPVVALNLKAYSTAIGENSVELAEMAKEVHNSTGIEIIVVPQAVDIVRISDIITTFAQHVDPVKAGSRTGSVLPEGVKEAGATGSLLNHSENRIPHDQIKESIERLRQLKMESIVCTNSPEESAEIAPFEPTAIAVEPPELIGSGVSVSQAKPEIVTNTVEKIRAVNQNTKILCGAGISNGDDAKKALELGVEGVLLASAFTKAEDPKKVLEDICGGFK